MQSIFSFFSSCVQTSSYKDQSQNSNYKNSQQSFFLVFSTAIMRERNLIMIFLNEMIQLFIQLQQENDMNEKILQIARKNLEFLTQLLKAKQAEVLYIFQFVVKMLVQTNEFTAQTISKPQALNYQFTKLRKFMLKCLIQSCEY